MCSYISKLIDKLTKNRICHGGSCFTASVPIHLRTLKDILQVIALIIVQHNFKWSPQYQGHITIYIILFSLFNSLNYNNKVIIRSILVSLSFAIN